VLPSFCPPFSPVHTLVLTTISAAPRRFARFFLTIAAPIVLKLLVTSSTHLLRIFLRVLLCVLPSILVLVHILPSTSSSLSVSTVIVCFT
jgi:hypothetical protein